ncbi:LPXTG-site transpeptidase (sortase) family protein [Streptomyces griseochromogenes]|uniref:Class F sortase n=1 Tax=Streptomyces griseochromogenes TaxID=68214 RepID=A0A1B1B1G0_9ACTN|nr:class F sortase [Streptomyces griseochromogenes]ANP52653.1 class F sortase [Streptomyces griseochromogenes]MBP2047245.1 LPXTG-site transpeptidase (sortase) family protein [Streptomyces griseochromogenes]
MAADPSSAPGEQGARRGGRRTLWAVVIVVLAVTVFGGPHGAGDPAGTSRASGSSAARTDPRGAGEALPRSTPLRLLIPKISVDAPFTALTIGGSGQLEPPPSDNTNLVGWYVDGASPGEKGTAVIAGHVDTATSAAVFANLDRLEEGDLFSVDRADGRRASFVVDDTETFPKDDFPSKRVYADTSRPELRLITCAGDYDHTVNDYTDNLVVFAHLL